MTENRWNVSFHVLLIAAWSLLVCTLAVAQQATNSVVQNSQTQPRVVSFEWSCSISPALHPRPQQIFQAFNFTLIPDLNGHPIRVSADLSQYIEYLRELSRSPLAANLESCVAYETERLKRFLTQECNRMPAAYQLGIPCDAPFFANSGQMEIIEAIERSFPRTPHQPLFLPGEEADGAVALRATQRFQSVVQRLHRYCRPVGYGESHELGLRLYETYSAQFLRYLSLHTDLEVSGQCWNQLFNEYVSAFQTEIARARDSEFAGCILNLNRPGCERPHLAFRNILSIFRPHLPIEVGLIVANACPAPTSQPFSMPATMKQIDSIANCVELRPNEARSVFVPSQRSKTGIPQNYVLRRDRNGRYSVDLSISFYSAEMRNRLTRCLPEINSFLERGSLDGHVGPLSIRLLDRAQFFSGYMYSALVEPLDSGLRSDSQNWAADIDCSTAAHEVMHILGLVDEYPETWMGYVSRPASNPPYEWVPTGATSAGYNCRIIGPENSIMRDHRAAFRNARLTRQSFLYEAQYRSIIFPNCESRNQEYFRCAATAYLQTPLGSPRCSSQCLGPTHQEQQDCTNNTNHTCLREIRRRSRIWLR